MINIEDLKTFSANAAHAARNKQTVSIGGGKFSPAELKNVVAALDHVEVMRKKLAEIVDVLKSHPDRERGNSTVHYSYFAAISALAAFDSQVQVLGADLVSESKVFEVCAQGFDGSSDETDDCVFWVSAASADIVIAEIKDTGATFGQELTDVLQADVDFCLPAQSLAFSSALLEKASEARNRSRVVPKG